jgi:hypothetical protein
MPHILAYIPTKFRERERERETCLALLQWLPMFWTVEKKRQILKNMTAGIKLYVKKKKIF